MPDLELRTSGESIDYEFTVSESVEGVSGTVGSRTGDGVSDDGKTAQGGLRSDDEFDRWQIEGDILAFEPQDDPGLTTLLDGEEVDPSELVTDPTEQPRRFYIYGDQWKPREDRDPDAAPDPIYYTAAFRGEVERTAKSDQFDEIHRFGDEVAVVGSVPANADDAFTVTGEVLWMHGPRDRLGVQLDHEPYTPSWRTENPLTEEGTGGNRREDENEDGRNNNGDGGDDTDGGSDDDSDSGSGGDDDSGDDSGSEDGGDSKPADPYSHLTTDGPDGPDPDLAAEFDHYVEINGTDYSNRLRYHLMATGEIQPASTGDSVDNRSWISHAEGSLQAWKDGYYYNGTLLDVKVGPLSVGEHRRKQGDDSLGVYDLPYAVFVDGVAIDHDRFDPRTAAAGTPLDIPIGFRDDGLPAELSPDPDDADFLIRSAEDLFDAFDSASDGDVLVVDDAVDYEGGDGTVLSSDADALTLACTSDGHLKRTNTPSDHWGNFSTRFSGKHLSFINFTHEGAFTEPRGYNSGGSFALTTDGRYPAFLNCKLWNWGVTGLDFRGHGETVLGYDAHDIQIDGSGYGIGTSGEAELEGDNPDEYNWVQPWHERTSMKFLRIDGCRHFLERAKNVATEARWYVFGENSRHGSHTDDMHRFARGEDVRTDRVLMKPNPAVPGDAIRGRPRLTRLARTWYAGWDEEWQDQVDPRQASRNPGDDDDKPFGQYCVTDPEYKDRTYGYDTSDGPLVPAPGDDLTIWQFDVGTLQVGGTRPDFITNQLYNAVRHFRDKR